MAMPTTSRSVPETDPESGDTPDDGKLLFPDIFIYAAELFTAIKELKNILLVDIRLPVEFEVCRVVMKKGQLINIPEDLIIPGLSEKCFEASLEADIRRIWEKRDTFEAIVLIDRHSQKFTYEGSKLSILRSFILQWDINRTYRQQPVVLIGGIEEYAARYSTGVTNAQVFLSKSNSDIDELLRTDIIDYPEYGSKPKRMTLRIQAEGFTGYQQLRIKRDFEEDESPEISISEGHSPKDSYATKDLSIVGPFQSISEPSLPTQNTLGLELSYDYYPELIAGQIPQEEVAALQEADGEASGSVTDKPQEISKPNPTDVDLLTDNIHTYNSYPELTAGKIPQDEVAALQEADGEASGSVTDKPQEISKPNPIDVDLLTDNIHTYNSYPELTAGKIPQDEVAALQEADGEASGSVTDKPQEISKPNPIDVDLLTDNIHTYDYYPELIAGKIPQDEVAVLQEADGEASGSVTDKPQEISKPNPIDVDLLTDNIHTYDYYPELIAGKIPQDEVAALQEADGEASGSVTDKPQEISKPNPIDVDLLTDNIHNVLKSFKDDLQQEARARKPGKVDGRGDRNENQPVPKEEAAAIKNVQLSTDSLEAPATVIKYKLVVDDGYTGLTNQKNISYMNCLVQCLKVIPLMKKTYVLTDDYFKLTTLRPPNLNFAMAVTLQQLWRGTYRRPSVYHLTYFQREVSLLRPVQDINRHQDMFEFFIFIFNILNNDCSYDIPYILLMNESERAWYSHMLGRSSFLADSFYYQLRSNKLCYYCRTPNFVYEIKKMLMLPVPDDDKCQLETLIMEYLKDDLIPDYSCTGCQCSATIVNKKELIVEPKVLVIVLKRTIVDFNGSTIETDTEIEFPLTDLKFGSEKYKLYAIAHHIGSKAKGHYFATVLLKPEDNTWAVFDDDKPISHCKVVGKGSNVNRNIAGFFYVREERDLA